MMNRIKPNYPGRHLLHHPGTIRLLIREAGVRAGDIVMDIGAGAGAVTWPLAAVAGKVVAVEQDVQDADRLREKAADYPQVTVVQEDFRFMRLPGRIFICAANIPFSITTAVLEKLLGPEGRNFTRGAFIVEKGAARRFTTPYPAEPRLLAWRLMFIIEYRHTVPRSCFSPPPRVDAAILRIERRQRPLLHPGQYRRFCAFAGQLLRTGTLQDGLRGIFTPAQMTKALREAGTDRLQPPSSLSPEQWGVLFQTMMRFAPAYRWPR